MKKLEKIAKARADKDAKKQMEQLKKDVDVLRVIVKEKFWPIVKGKTVFETDTLCQLVGGRIQEYFNAMVKTVKVSELGLDKVFVEGDEMKTLDILQDLTIAQASQILVGMGQAIDACIRREQKTRPITDLTELVKEFE